MNLSLVPLRPAAYALAVIAGLGSPPALAQALAQPEPRLDVIYIPTPQPIVDRMLDIAQVKPGDYMIDFGCGDGRMVVSAAKRGARGYGVDIDPARIKEANENARKAGVTDRVEFKIANLFEEDLSKADVMAMYLLTDINLRLRPKILDTMKPGARIVSHSFDMGEWEPELRDTVDHKNVFFWIVPAKVQGKWQVEDEQKYTLDLDQKFQMVSGKANIGGKPANVSGRLSGAEITLTVDAGGTKQQLKGKVDGNQIVGTNWKATRS
jgi:SAM-dependent methyltransferase